MPCAYPLCRDTRQLPGGAPARESRRGAVLRRWAHDRNARREERVRRIRPSHPLRGARRDRGTGRSWEWPALMVRGPPGVLMGRAGSGSARSVRGAPAASTRNAAAGVCRQGYLRYLPVHSVKRRSAVNRGSVRPRSWLAASLTRDTSGIGSSGCCRLGASVHHVPCVLSDQLEKC